MKKTLTESQYWTCPKCFKSFHWVRDEKKIETHDCDKKDKDDSWKLTRDYCS